MQRKHRRSDGVGPIAAMLVFAAVGLRAEAPAPDVGSAKIAAEVRTRILRLPYYGVFDLISFQLDGDQVTLGGDVYRAALKEEAEKAVAKIPGVTRVVNGIEILPTSIADDRLRSASFHAIYTDDFLSRYGTPVGGGLGPLFAGRRLWGRGFGSRAFQTGAGRLGRAPFLGMEPLGNYAIHIIVDQGAVNLYGVVDNDAGKTKAGMDVRQILGVRSVNNEIQVVSDSRRAKKG